MSEFDLDVFEAFEEIQEPNQVKKPKLSQEIDLMADQGALFI